MKRLLMATSALCLGAGAATAEVALSGVAEMGVVGSKDDSVRFHTDVNVTFTLSGETDGGVAFGTSVDLSEVSDDKLNEKDGQLRDDATNNDDAHGGIAVFMEDADGFGKLTLGDTNGALAWAVSDARGAVPGSIRDENEHGGSSGNDGLDGKHDGQILIWNRAIAAGFSAAASVELDDDTGGTPTSNTHDPIIGLGGKYSMGMGVGTLGLGLGFQMGSFDHEIKAPQLNSARKAGTKNTAASIWNKEEVEGTAFGGSVSMDFTAGGDGLTVIADAGVVQADGSRRAGTPSAVTHTADVEMTHLGLGLGYTVGAISLGVNAGTKAHEESVDAAGANGVTKVETTVNGVGFTAAYDLGGGASLKFGVGSSETEYDWTLDAVSGGTAAGAATLSGGTDAGYDHSMDSNSWSLGVAFSF